MYDGEGDVETGQHDGDASRVGGSDSAESEDAAMSSVAESDLHDGQQPAEHHDPTDSGNTASPGPQTRRRWIPGFFYGHDNKDKPKKAKLRWPTGPGASRGQDKNNLD